MSTSIGNKGKDLTKRYYLAEGAIWTLSLVLIFSHFLGLALDQELPILNITLRNSQHYPFAVALMLIGACLYMEFEWKYSSHDSKESSQNSFRMMITASIAISSLLISYPTIVRYSSFHEISRFWFLGFLAIGFLFGVFVSTLVFSALMIRSAKDSKQLQLPRVPAVTRKNFFILSPLFLFLLFLYYLLHYYSPSVLYPISAFLVLVPFMFIIAGEITSLFFYYDENNQRMPYKKRIAYIREAVDFHDYAYHLIEHGEELAQDLSLPEGSTPQDMQMEIQKKFAASETRAPINFHVQVLEELELEIYPKDGNTKNIDKNNNGIKIRKRGGSPDNIRVLFLPDNEEYSSRELTLSIRNVEKCAEDFMRKQKNPKETTPEKCITYALNTAVISVLVEESGHILHRLVQSGMEAEVADAIKNHADVNEKAEAGWTPLLYAVAQGYPEIVKILLDAGANPDDSNVHKITPLMYSARYGNLEICKILLDHVADLNVQDVYGMSALIVASRDGHIEVVKELLDAGADPRIITLEGKKALDYAYERGHGQIAKLLKKAEKNL